MLSRQEEDRERREVLRNDALVRRQQEEQSESRRVFAQDQSLPNQATTMHQFAQSDADVPRGRFTSHEHSTVVGGTPIPVYPPGPAWCADPGSQCVEPPLGLDNPALEHHREAQATPNPASGDVAPSAPLDVEQRDAGLGPFSDHPFRRE